MQISVHSRTFDSVSESVAKCDATIGLIAMTSSRTGSERKKSSHGFSPLGHDDRFAALGDVVEKLEAFGLESSCGDRAHESRIPQKWSDRNDHLRHVSIGLLHRYRQGAIRRR